MNGAAEFGTNHIPGKTPTFNISDGASTSHTARTGSYALSREKSISRLHLFSACGRFM